MDELMKDRSYVEPVPWEWSEVDGRVVLGPRRRPYVSHVILVFLLMPAFTYGIYAATAELGQASELLIRVACITLPILTLLGFALIYWLQWRFGPWIVFDREARRLELPRTGVTLGVDDVYIVQVAHGILGQGGGSPTRVFEVNVFVLGDDATPEGTRRYGVVGTKNSKDARAVATRLKELLGRLDPASDSSSDS